MDEEIYAGFMLSANFPVANVDRLNELLDLAFQPRFAEIWLTGPRAALLISKNADKAWVMFDSHSDDPSFDASFHAINPTYTGPEGVSLKLYVHNGQDDERPLGEWIPMDEAKRIAQHFYLHGERAPDSTWFDDFQ